MLDLLQAIQENPFDRQLRLIYADYLEENANLQESVKQKQIAKLLENKTKVVASNRIRKAIQDYFHVNAHTIYLECCTKIENIIYSDGNYWQYKSAFDDTLSRLNFFIFHKGKIILSEGQWPVLPCDTFCIKSDRINEVTILAQPDLMYDLVYK